jgi:hypothetical protein
VANGRKVKSAGEHRGGSQSADIARTELCEDLVVAGSGLVIIQLGREVGSPADQGRKLRSVSASLGEDQNAVFGRLPLLVLDVIDHRLEPIGLGVETTDFVTDVGSAVGGTDRLPLGDAAELDEVL